MPTQSAGSSYPLLVPGAPFDLSPILCGPGENGYLTWTGDPTVLRNAQTYTSGTLYLFKLWVPQPAITLSAVDLWIANAGATLTSGQNLLGLYADPSGKNGTSGSKLWTSADQSSVWTSTGLKSATIAAGSPTSLTLSGGPGVYVYLALLSVGTTTPQPAGGSASNAAQLNANLAAAAYRCASNGTGQTALPASLTLSSNASYGNLAWAGVR